jgi:hypothetical protein
MLGGPQSLSGRGGEDKKKTLPLSGIEPWWTSSLSLSNFFYVSHITKKIKPWKYLP